MSHLFTYNVTYVTSYVNKAGHALIGWGTSVGVAWHGVIMSWHNYRIILFQWNVSFWYCLIEFQSVMWQNRWRMMDSCDMQIYVSLCWNVNTRASPRVDISTLAHIYFSMSRSPSCIICIVFSAIQVKPTFLISDIRALRAERQSARISEINNVGLTRMARLRLPFKELNDLWLLHLLQLTLTSLGALSRWQMNDKIGWFIVDFIPGFYSPMFSAKLEPSSTA